MRAHWLIPLLAMGCPENSAPVTDVGPTEAGASDAGDQLDSGSPGPDAGGPDAATFDTPPFDGGATPDCGECPEGQRCSVYGQCFQGDCLVHGDCTFAERCLAGRCIGRPSTEEGIIFERVNDGVVSEHYSAYPYSDERRNAHIWGDMGFGAALFDPDGDGDLDLFIGTQSFGVQGSTPSCLYRNVSIPSAPAFERVEAYCQPKPPGISGAYGLDIDNDGFHELLMTGFETAIIQRFHPEEEQIDLMALLPGDDPRRSCNAGAAVSFDVDMNGYVDVVVGCQWDGVKEHGESGLNLLFLQDEFGWRSVSEREWNGENHVLLSAWGSTLGLGAAHIDNDGLLDMLVSEDDGTRPGFEVQHHPGGIYMRCAPTEPCQFRSQRIGPNTLAWGSYMGSGLIHVRNVGELAYFSNLDANRAVNPSYDPTVDVANFHRIHITTGLPIFSWGVVVDDFNRDGLDDLFVSQGATSASLQREYADHDDVLMLQTPSTIFTSHTDDVNLALVNTLDSRSEYNYAPRAAIRADLDNDGFLDLVETAMEGVVRIQREVPQQSDEPPRCTIIPRPRVVQGFGVGVAVRGLVDTTWRQWDSQGQLRSGTTPYPLSPWSRGYIRFASGVEVPFNCGNTAGPIVVEEPDWLQLERQGDRLSIFVGTGAPEGRLNVHMEPIGQEMPANAGEVVADGRRFTVDLAPGTQTVMLRFGDWWVGRIFRP